MHAILEAVFPSRIEAVRALLAPASPDSLAALAVAADKAREALAHVNDNEAQADWQALAEALGIAHKLRAWHLAVRAGEGDADRFLRAAQLQLGEWQVAEQGYGARLREVLSRIEAGCSPTDIAGLLRALAQVPFPVGAFTTEPKLAWRPPAEAQQERPRELAVAFLEFKIDGREAAAVHRLPANVVHDLEVAVRVSRWPDAADRLVLKPVTIESADTWRLPVFEFDRPPKGAPLTFEAHGRIRILQATSVGARPLEFQYAAEFLPTSSEQPIAVAGQRSLRIDSSATDGRPETGYPSLDSKLLEVRNRLRNEPRIPDSEVATAISLFKPLANLVGQSVQDNSFPRPIDEQAFERQIIPHLRRYPEIGAELEVQAQAGGGRTDLSFRQVRLELKVKNDSRVTDEDLERYSQQAAAYAASSAKTIACLCVLDGSAKDGPPLPVEECIKVIPVQPGDRPIYVISFLVQGNLARPSSLSRR